MPTALTSVQNEWLRQAKRFINDYPDVDSFIRGLHHEADSDPAQTDNGPAARMGALLRTDLIGEMRQIRDNGPLGVSFEDDMRERYAEIEHDVFTGRPPV